MAFCGADKRIRTSTKTIFTRTWTVRVCQFRHIRMECVFSDSQDLVYTKMRFIASNFFDFVVHDQSLWKASLMRWNKRFDGTKNSLRDKPHRPISPHPNAHTQTGLNRSKPFTAEIPISLSAKCMASSASANVRRALSSESPASFPAPSFPLLVSVLN